MLGNADAMSRGWYLKRLEDYAGDDTGMFVRQVAKGKEPLVPEPPVNPDPCRSLSIPRLARRSTPTTPIRTTPNSPEIPTGKS